MWKEIFFSRGLESFIYFFPQALQLEGFCMQ
nr:MAG TPA: hypothetical protein [Caudoviricetes sp.]